MPSAAGLGGPERMLGEHAAIIRQRLAMCRQKQPYAALACSRAGASSPGHEYVRSLIRAHVYMLEYLVVFYGHLGWYRGWVLLWYACHVQQNAGKTCCDMRHCRCGYQCTSYGLMHGRFTVCVRILSLL